MEEMLGRIVNTTQVPQAPSAFKSQIEIVLDVGDFHLTPNMTIVLAIHALHLFRMTSWKMNRATILGDNSKMMSSLNVMGRE
jgi:hypothetical protein